MPTDLPHILSAVLFWYAKTPFTGYLRPKCAGVRKVWLLWLNIFYLQFLLLPLSVPAFLCGGLKITTIKQALKMKKKGTKLL